jgi:hypothetical protein
MSTIWNRRGVVYSVAALVAVVLYLAAHQM